MARSATPSKGRRRWHRTIDARKRLQQTPGLIESVRLFSPVYRLLRDLSRDQADSVRGRVVLAGWEPGEYLEAGTALEGWVRYWQRLIAGEALEINLGPMAQLQRYLAGGVLLDPDLIAKAKACTDECYRAYIHTPAERINAYSIVEQIAMQLDFRGLRGEASAYQDDA